MSNQLIITVTNIRLSLLHSVTTDYLCTVTHGQLSQLPMYRYKWSTVTITYVPLHMVNCHYYLCTVTNGQLSLLPMYRYTWSTVTITYVPLQMVNCHYYLCTVTHGQLSQLPMYCNELGSWIT